MYTCTYIMRRSHTDTKVKVVCVCVCGYTHTHTNIHIYMHNTYTYTYTYMYIWIIIWLHSCVNTYKHVLIVVYTYDQRVRTRDWERERRCVSNNFVRMSNVCVCVCVCVCVYWCTHIKQNWQCWIGRGQKFVHTYMDVYRYIYIHIHTYSTHICIRAYMCP